MDGKTSSEIQSEACAEDNEEKAARKQQKVKEPSVENDKEPEPHGIYPHWEEAKIILGTGLAEERHVHLKRRKPLDADNIKRINWDETWKDFFYLETEVVEYLDWFEEVMSADGQTGKDDEGSPDMECQQESIIPFEDQDEAAMKVKNHVESSIVIENQNGNSTAAKYLRSAMNQEEADIAAGNQNETFLTVSDKVRTTISVDNRDQNSITVGNQDPNAFTVGHQDPNSITIGNQVERSIAANKDETEIHECSQDKITTAASNQGETATTMGYHDKATATEGSCGSKSSMSRYAASISLNIDECSHEKYCNDEKSVTEVSSGTSNQSSNYENNATVRCSAVKLSNVEKFKLRLVEFSSVAYKYMCAISGVTYSWMKRGSDKNCQNDRLVNQTGTDNTDSTTISENQVGLFTSHAELKQSPNNSHCHSHANKDNISVAFNPQYESVINDLPSTLLLSDKADISTHFPKFATRTNFSSERSVTCCEVDVTESASSNDSNSIEKNLTETGSNLRRFTEPSPISGNSSGSKFNDERRIETGELEREHDVAAPTAVENQENVIRKNIVEYTDCYGKVFTEEELALLVRIIRQNIASHFRRFEGDMDKLFDFTQHFFEIIEYHVDHDTDMSKDLDIMICHLYDLQQFMAHLVDLGVGYCTRVRKLLKDMRSEYSEVVHEDYEGFLKDFLSILDKLIIIISDLKDFFLQIFDIFGCCNH